MPSTRGFAQRFGSNQNLSNWSQRQIDYPLSRAVARGFAVPPLDILTTSADLEGAGGYDDAIWPMVVPWPFTQDAMGIAFPAGLVGLLTRTPLDPTYEASALTEPRSSEWRYLIPVPSTLPSGYARVDALPWWERSANGFGPRISYDNPGGVPWGFAGPSVGDYRIVGAGLSIGVTSKPTIWGSDRLLYEIDWYPQAIDDLVSLMSASLSIAGDAEAVRNSNGDDMQPSAGWRNINVTNWSATVGTTIQVQSSPDGAAWTTRETLTGNGNYTLAQAPTARLLQWRLLSVGGFGAVTADLTFSPRCDIPPWFTVCGIDDSGNHLIAPGGIPSGLVPGYP